MDELNSKETSRMPGDAHLRINVTDRCLTALKMVEMLRSKFEAKAEDSQPRIQGAFIDTRILKKGIQYHCRAVISINDDKTLHIVPRYFCAEGNMPSLWMNPTLGKPIITPVPVDNVESAGDALWEWTQNLVNLNFD